MPLRSLAVALLATVIFVPASASAIPIHVHEKVPVHHERIVSTKLPGELVTKRWTTMKEVVHVEHVAPADPDDNGIAGTQAPEPVPAPAYTEDTSSSYVAEPSYSSGGCPASMAAEASSPTAVNPTSGAAGCYQVLPSTAAAMGSACADVNASSCVAAICASQGNGAWSASGATPCG